LEAVQLETSPRVLTDPVSFTKEPLFSGGQISSTHAYGVRPNAFAVRVTNVFVYGNTTNDKTMRYFRLRANNIRVPRAMCVVVKPETVRVNQDELRAYKIRVWVTSEDDGTKYEIVLANDTITEINVDGYQMLTTEVAVKPKEGLPSAEGSEVVDTKDTEDTNIVVDVPRSVSTEGEAAVADEVVSTDNVTKSTLSEAEQCIADALSERASEFVGAIQKECDVFLAIPKTTLLESIKRTTRKALDTGEPTARLKLMSCDIKVYGSGVYPLIRDGVRELVILALQAHGILPSTRFRVMVEGYDTLNFILTWSVGSQRWATGTRTARTFVEDRLGTISITPSGSGQFTVDGNV
jgi:hypothetical protein